jgi:hypothetical protein
MLFTRWTQIQNVEFSLITETPKFEMRDIRRRKVVAMEPDARQNESTINHK